MPTISEFFGIIRIPKIIKAAILSIFFIPACAYADVIIHTASVHIVSRGVNNFNPGIGYSYKKLRAGVVYNSFKHASFYAVSNYNISDKFKIGAGVITGYELDLDKIVIVRNDVNIMPMFAVEYDISENWSIVLFGDALNLEFKF